MDSRVFTKKKYQVNYVMENVHKVESFLCLRCERCDAHNSLTVWLTVYRPAWQTQQWSVDGQVF